MNHGDTDSLMEGVLTDDEGYKYVYTITANDLAQPGTPQYTLTATGNVWVLQDVSSAGAGCCTQTDPTDPNSAYSWSSLDSNYNSNTNQFSCGQTYGWASSDGECVIEVSQPAGYQSAQAISENINVRLNAGTGYSSYLQHGFIEETTIVLKFTESASGLHIKSGHIKRQHSICNNLNAGNECDGRYTAGSILHQTIKPNVDISLLGDWSGFKCHTSTSPTCS